MWPEILKLEYNPAEFYNYGRAGAGNRYISHQVCHANLVHEFTSDDMVIISWTHIFRTDWYNPEDFSDEYEFGWETRGNIYNPHGLNAYLHPATLAPVNFIARDLHIIYMTINMLQRIGVPNYQIQICPITKRINESFEDTIDERERNHAQLLPFIKFCEENILDSYEEHIDVKPTWFKEFPQDEESMRSDYHPMPLHHCDYLEKVVGLQISQNTREVAKRSQDAVFEFIRQERKDKPDDFGDFNSLFTDLEHFIYLDKFI